MILAGDIGGTKTVLARWERRPAAEGVAGGAVLVKLREEIYRSSEHASLEEIIALFRKEDAAPYDVACFGVAGPVVDGECRTTNLPWLLTETALAKSAGVRRAKLLNDLEAAAFGMLFLTTDQVLTLQEGTRSNKAGTVAVLAAGTGLGEAILHWDGTRHHPMPSEGGHSTFAAQSAEEAALMLHLQQKYGEHVSWERVVSGPAFPVLYEFFRDRLAAGGVAEPGWLRERLARENPSAVITEIGMKGDEPITRKTVEAFATFYGAEAGNHALKCLALGGVFLGGNIAGILFPTMAEDFLRGFHRKGRLSSVLKSVPVRVARDPRAPLIGAAYFGATL